MEGGIERFARDMTRIWQHLKLKIPSVLVLLVGIGGALCGYAWLRATETAEIKHAFQTRADELALTAEKEIQSNVSAVHALGTFLETVPVYNRRGFEAYVQGMLTQYPHLQAWEWIPRVPGSERSAFEERIRREGHAEFEISEKDRQGKLVTAGDRAAYYPVCYVVPFEGNEAAVGFDLASEQVRRDALIRAMDTGRMVATAPVRLVQETEQQSGFLLFHPVYETDAPCFRAKQRREALRGFALGVFRAHDVLATAFSSTHHEALQVTVYDRAASRSDRLVARFPPESGPMNGSTDATLRTHHRPIQVAGREWEIVVTAKPAYAASRRTWQPLLATIIAGLLVSLISAVLVKSRRHTRYLEQVVVERTATLRKSENNFRSFCETVDDVILIAKPDGKIIYANPGSVKRLGYSADELTRMHVLDAHRPADRQMAAHILSEMVKGRQRYCPLPLLAKDGHLVPVETRTWQGQWNHQDALYAISKDLSEQQSALQMFERVFEANPTPMALSKLPNRVFIKANGAFCKVTGYEKDEVLGNTSESLGLFADPDHANVVAQKLAAEKSMYNVSVDIRTKDGSIRKGLFFGEVVDSQGVQYFLTTMIDITERKNFEESLRRKSQELATLLDTLPAFAFFKNDESQYVAVNETLCQAVERPRAQIIGMTDYDVFPEDLAKKYHRDDLQILRGKKEILEVEEEMVRGSGRCCVATRKVAVRDEDDNVVGLIGLGFDISMQKQIESELREARQTLELRVAERTEELRAANRTLTEENTRRREAEASLEENREDLRRLASQLILSEEEQRRELAVQLHDSIGQELAMARLRLEHSRAGDAEQGHQHLAATAELLDSAMRHVHTLTHDLGGTVLYDLGLPAALRSLCADVTNQHGLEASFEQIGEYQRCSREIEVHLFRAARELTFNVMKHARASRVTMRLVMTTSRIVVNVNDDGCGFVPEVGLQKNSCVGSGFGLFSIRERLLILGGWLNLDSTPGQGTTATVTIPRNSTREQESASGGNHDQYHVG